MSTLRNGGAGKKHGNQLASTRDNVTGAPVTDAHRRARALAQSKPQTNNDNNEEQ